MLNRPLPSARNGWPAVDPAGSFRLAEAWPGAVYGSGNGGVSGAVGGSAKGSVADAGAGDIDVIRDGQPQYRLELRERALADFGPTCWWQQTSPESHFTRTTICSRLTASGRISISGRTLIRTADGIRTEQELPADDAVIAAYRDHFGIILDRVPAVAAEAG